MTECTPAVPAGRTAGAAGTDTRTRIMYEASLLFAERGFYGTSTREIAEAVGVRQPSLFHYFPTKQDIFAELLSHDLVPALARISNALQLPGPVAPRLHAYLRVDVRAILELPYDVRGLYDDHVLLLPELHDQAMQREQLHSLTRKLVLEGIATGEFVATDVFFAQLSVTALVLQSVRSRNSTSKTFAREQSMKVADFVLRALLVDPAGLPGVKRVSAVLVRQV